MRSAHLNSTLQWRTRPRSNPRSSDPSHRQGSRHQRREPLCARKHRVWCDNVQTPQFHCDLQPRPCKSQKNYVDKGYKHTHEAASAVRSAHLNSTLQSESEIKSLRSGPSHRRSSPHRRREPQRARKHRVSSDSYRPSITLTQPLHCDLQSRPCNHKRTTSTKAANMKQPLQCDLHA